MNLDEVQTARVRQWIDQGLKVAEIQTRLADELGVRLTYMEARFLLDDLKLRPKDPPPPPKPSSTVLGPSAPTQSGGTAPAGSPAAASKMADAHDLPAPGGRVSVAVDEIARPGALASGKVTFSDGKAADWQMDQLGRLAVVPKQQGYKPSQADIASFQAELDSALSRMGY